MYVYSVSLLILQQIFFLIFSLRRDVLTPPLPNKKKRLVPGYDKILSLLVYMNERNKAGVH